MIKDDQDKVRIYCAAASMYAKAHDVNAQRRPVGQGL
jgi:hypothetical protein